MKEKDIILSSFEEIKKGDFVGITQTQNPKNRPFSVIIQSIRTGVQLKNKVEFLRSQFDKETQQALKRNLPHFTPSGVFSVRNDSGLQEFSGLLHFDLDKLEDVEKTKLMLIDKLGDYLHALFTSPRGNGLKIFFVTSNDILHRKATFEMLSKFFQKNNLKIDAACKDVARTCFYSHDPEAYYNPTSNAIIPPNMSDIETFELLINAIPRQHNISFSGGNRNNFVFYLACACNRCGISQETTLQECSKLVAEDFTFAEIEKTVKNGYAKSASEKGNNPLKSHSTPQTVHESKPQTVQDAISAQIEIVNKKYKELGAEIEKLERLKLTI